MANTEKNESFDKAFMITTAVIIIIPLALLDILPMYIGKEYSNVVIEIIKASVWATACSFLVSGKYYSYKPRGLQIKYIPLVWISVFLFFVIMYRVFEYLQGELNKLLTFGFAEIGLQPYESFVNFISSAVVFFTLLVFALIVANLVSRLIPNSADSVC